MAGSTVQLDLMEFHLPSELTGQSPLEMAKSIHREIELLEKINKKSREVSGGDEGARVKEEDQEPCCRTRVYVDEE